LNFNTGESDLKDIFSKFGNVSDAYIVRRRGRSAGYGFVEFENADDAEEALNKLNNSIIEDREVNIAFSRGTIVKSDAQSPPQRGGGYRYGGGGYGGGGYSGGGYSGGGYRDNQRSPQQRSPQQRSPQQSNRGPQRFSDNSNYRGRRGGFGGYGGRGGRGGYRLRPLRDNEPRNAPRRNQRNNNRRQRSNSNISDKEKTTATLFVSNLPYSVDDEQLAKLFSKFDIKTAHVVVRRRDGRSNGYGFVEFNSEEAQLHALKEMDGTPVTGSNGVEREITVKIALVDKDNDNENRDQKNDSDNDEKQNDEE
jgi:RNA recognition motif-containing protein